MLTTLSQSLPPNLVPASDSAGEIIAVGEDVKDWKVGQKVCANFATDHTHGPATPASANTALGGQAHGVLTQYRAFPSHVRSIFVAWIESLTESFNSRL